MIIYRLATAEFATNISGDGAKIYGGRWNPIGIAVLYTSEYISLAILEILVRATEFTSPDAYTLVSIELPEDSISTIEIKKLRPEWQIHIEYTQWIGEQFLKNNDSLALKVPSGIVTQEHNFLLNPLHEDFSKVKIISTELLNLDKRLFKQV